MAGTVTERWRDDIEHQAMEIATDKLDLYKESIGDAIRNYFGITDFATPYIEVNGAEKFSFRGNLSDEELDDILRGIIEKYRGCFPEDSKAWFVVEPLLWGVSQGLDNFLDRMCGIYKEELSAGEREMLDEVEDALSHRKIKELILGEFIPSANTIKLYVRNIEKNCDFYRCDTQEEKQNEFEVNARGVLAHEMFHAYHYQVAKRTFKSNTSHAEIVKEALADFFSYMFSLDEQACSQDGTLFENSKSYAHSVACSWRWNRFYDWPYAYARFIMLKNGDLDFCDSIQECVNKGMMNKFQKVLELSCTSMEEAYEELVPEQFRKDDNNRRIDVRTNGVTRRKRSKWVVTKGTGEAIDEDDLIEILKIVIKINNIKSISELRNYFSDDVLIVIPGQFILFDSGELLSEYRQWKVLDIRRFLKRAAELGAPISFTGEGGRRETERSNRLSHFVLKIGGGFICEGMTTSYLEIDRDSNTIKTYRRRGSFYGLGNNEVLDLESIEVTDAEMDKLLFMIGNVNWNRKPDGTLFDGYCCDGMTWDATLAYEDGRVFNNHGGWEHPDTKHIDAYISTLFNQYQQGNNTKKMFWF